MKNFKLKPIQNLFCIIFIFILSNEALGQQNYYLSSSGGDDNNPGTLTEPFQTLDKISSIALGPGDTIYFKRGDRFAGHFVVNGSGSASQPITITSYGSGNQPILTGQVGAAAGGDYLEAIFVRNHDNLVFEDIEIQNERFTARPVDMSRLDNPNNTEAEQAILDEAKSYGIYILNELAGTRHNYTFRNLTIRNVFALKSVDPAQQQEFNAFEPAGITIATTWNYNGKVGNIDGILVEDCVFTNLQRLGVHIKQAGHGAGVGTDITNRTNNVVVRNNEFQHTGGTCVLPIRTYNCLIENNMFYYPGSTIDPRMPGRGSSVWPYYCINTVIQKNQCLHIRGILDSHGIHIDHSNDNTFVQYNYMEDCEGGFVEILGGNNNAVYRYNISVNDGWRVNPNWANSNHTIWINNNTGANTVFSTNTYIYNNTVFIDDNFTTAIDMEAENSYTFNNIFYAINGGMGSQQVRLVDNGTTMSFSNNLFHGNVATNFSNQDTNKQTANPSLYDEGASSALGYQLNAGSPAINNGKVESVPNVPGAGTGIFAGVTAQPTEDYFGNPLTLTAGNINIGACDAKNGEIVNYQNIPVTGVATHVTHLDLEVGNSKLVNIAIIPADATDKSVTWTSLDASVATVTDGLITGINNGFAEIIVTTTGGSFTDTVYVNVNGNCDPVSSVTINNCPSRSLSVGGLTHSLSAEVLPASACDNSITWTSSDTSLATVNANTGEVTPLVPGTVTITATSNADSSQKDTCDITIIEIPIGVTPVAGGKYYITNKGTGLAIGANGGEEVITSEYGTTGPNWEWTFSSSPSTGYFFIDCIDGAPGNERIRTDSTTYTDMEPNTTTGFWVRWRLDEESAGSKIYYMTTEYGTNVRMYQEADGTSRQSETLITDVSAQYIFHEVISCDPVSSVSIDNCPASSLTEDGTAVDLNANVSPGTVCDASVSWSSSNTSVATVDSSGVVTPISVGTATITVTTTDGGLTDDCIITVDALPQNCTSKPKRPTNFSIAPTCTGVIVSWTPPVEPFCAESYIIAYRINGSAWQNVTVSEGTTTQYSLDIVSEPSSITVRIRAENTISLGPWTSSATTNSTSCISTSKGINSNSKNNRIQKTTIYPNPTENSLYLNFNAKVEKASISIYNTLGQLIKTLELRNAKNADIDVSSVTNGMYFVRIVYDGSYETHSIIKK